MSWNKRHLSFKHWFVQKIQVKLIIVYVEQDAPYSFLQLYPEHCIGQSIKKRELFSSQLNLCEILKNNVCQVNSYVQEMIDVKSKQKWFSLQERLPFNNINTPRRSSVLYHKELVYDHIKKHADFLDLKRNSYGTKSRWLTSGTPIRRLASTKFSTLRRHFAKDNFG